MLQQLLCSQFQFVSVDCNQFQMSWVNSFALMRLVQHPELTQVCHSLIEAHLFETFLRVFAVEHPKCQRLICSLNALAVCALFVEVWRSTVNTCLIPEIHSAFE